ncbi:hypothetical protein NEPAR06_1295 [Nematocida parisii]|uniref:uncharacterized protein n=1 Tax=Nematocida parisii (strain ERTm1 / ATCC PRA-289) TaxID=881290 RepID=UPI000264B20D|nr:uncharacterized protein NEPG_00492 [Nematocida parisii ERTm1]EIJ94967.1 hypothetical protein NEPG_00492 [Nematocida parisii ERTm1]KAI5154664.1 hypothetical protein NEPAR06_1295 [Nematocida parisii]|eukprot:XP_013058323.1 hypothetical protein NEPG_00492 [Nematocida parisii ERTm1]
MEEDKREEEREQITPEESSDKVSTEEHQETSERSENEEVKYSDENLSEDKDVQTDRVSDAREDEITSPGEETEGQSAGNNAEYIQSSNDTETRDHLDSFDKEEFQYSDERTAKTEETNRNESPSSYYSDTEKQDTEEEAARNSPEEKYSDKTEVSNSEDDIIEYKETTLPTKSEINSKRHLSQDDHPAKITKTDSTPEINKANFNQEENIAILEEIDKSSIQKTEMSNKGWKYNNRPLLWKPTIEAYEDDVGVIDEEAIIHKFRAHIEYPSMYNVRKITADPYYTKISARNKKPLSRHALLKVKERLENNKILEVQRSLRRRTLEEKNMLNKTRNLHVKLKQMGHKTEASNIFALLTQEYIFQKKDIVQSMENTINTLSYINNRLVENEQYLLKCLDFVNQKVTIE